MSFTDQELVERTKRGDNAAFGELWARYERQVIAFCRRFLAGPPRDPAVDEHDLTTDAFIRALHGLERYQDRTREGIGFENWLLEVARRTCLKFLARQRRRSQWGAPIDRDDLEERPDAARTAPQLTEEREVLRLAAQAINALPDVYRVPFKLFLEERSQREIAASLGISVDATAKRVQRARRLLQPRLAGLFGWPSGREQRSRRRARVSLRAVEQALTDIVSDYRIVTVSLPGGPEMQLCLRVDPQIAGRAPEIEAQRARLQNRPRAWKQRLELAELCYHGGFWEQALHEYREVLDRHPGCFPAALRLGEMLLQEGKEEEAAQVYRAALREQPPAALAAQLRAYQLAAQGKDEAAVKAFRRAIRLVPREKASYRGLSATLGRLSRYEEQLETLARLRELDPDDLSALVGVYTPCARLGRFDIARPLLERAVEIDPNYPMAVKHLFQVRMNLGLRDAQTLELAERLVRLAPEFVASWAELAWAYAELGRDDESLAVLHQFLAEHPNNAEAHAALAWRYHYMDRDEEVAHARRAYALEPQNWHVCWTFLVACGRGADLVPDAEALQAAEQVAARFPTDAAALQWVSGVYCHRRREAEALEYARRAVAVGPASLEARGNLAALCSAFQRWREASGIYECLVQMPGGVRWLRGWGSALKALNDPRADEVFAEAVARAHREGDDLEAAQAYEDWGKRHEAIAAYCRCLSQSPLPTAARRCARAGLQRLVAA
jgi:RNA polymerase sigma factor (sigma-70 family)